MIFDDIFLAPEFFNDYEEAPLEIKNRANTKLSRWAVTGSLPPSAQAHRAHLYSDVWIVYLNKGRGGWRLLVTINNRVLVFKRLLNHDDVDKALRV